MSKLKRDMHKKKRPWANAHPENNWFPGEKYRDSDGVVWTIVNAAMFNNSVVCRGSIILKSSGTHRLTCNIPQSGDGSDSTAPMIFPSDWELIEQTDE